MKPNASGRQTLTCVLITALALTLTVSGCDKRGSLADLRAHGIVSVRDGAPFCIIYVGLESNEQNSVYSTFWHFADRNGIQKPRKHYTSYSGPPRAAGMSDHVALYLRFWPTPDVLARYKAFSDEGVEAHSWSFASDNAYMPTNACLMKMNGQEILAPYTGIIALAPYDTNYPVADFKKLSEGLIAAIQAAFPDRAIRFVSYYGEGK